LIEFDNRGFSSSPVDRFSLIAFPGILPFTPRTAMVGLAERNQSLVASRMRLQLNISFHPFSRMADLRRI
jgi:hypothetical protein